MQKSFETLQQIESFVVHPSKLAEAMPDVRSMQHQSDRTHAADLADFANQNQRELYTKHHQIARHLFLPVQLGDRKAVLFRCPDL